MSNKTEFIRILSKLISFKTTEHEYSEVSKCLDYIKSELDFYPFYIQEFVSNKKKSLYLGMNDTLESTFLLTAHIDVVPAKDELYTLATKGDRIIGRGVFDMKFAVAMFIVTLKNIFQNTGKLPSVALLFTSEEEVEGNNGPGYVLEKYKLKADLAVLPDGGADWKIVTKSKGLLQLKVIAKGKSAHGAYPWFGQNAINALLALGLDAQKLYPIPTKNSWVTTLNIGKIQGGDSVNKVCEKAEMYLDIRFTEKTNMEEILKKVDLLLKKHPLCSYEFIDHLPAFYVDSKNQYLQKWAKLIANKRSNTELFTYENGASDATFFTEYDIPVLMCQPEGGNIHSDVEWLNVDSALTYIDNLEKLLMN